jgi:hypothetical protein
MDLHHWQESELAAVLRHQMQAPLRVGLETLPRQLAAELRVLCEAQGLLIRSVYDLLDHPLPPLELLRILKDFTKRQAFASGGALPRAVAMVIYYLTIATARIRHGERLTSLTDPEVEQGLDWVRGQAWLDDDTRTMAEERLRTWQQRFGEG